MAAAAAIGKIAVMSGTRGSREVFLAGELANDARFIAVFAHALQHAGGYAPEEARRVAEHRCPMCVLRPNASAVLSLTDDAADPQPNARRERNHRFTTALMTTNGFPMKSPALLMSVSCDEAS
jgi:hypothetical protein